MDEPTDAREPATTGPHDDWPWAYEVRCAKRLKSLSNDAIRMPVPFALAAAAFVYPFLAIPLFYLGELVRGFATGNRSLGDGSIWDLLGYPLFAGYVGLFLAMSTIVLSPMVWLVVLVVSQSLRIRPDPTRQAIYVANWTALLGSIALMVAPLILYRGDAPLSVFILAVVAGPGLAVPLAQYAGAWSQWPSAAEVVPPLEWRFGVRELLIATGWIALGLALLKGFGLLAPRLVIYLAVGNLYAWVTMGPVIRFCRWRARISKKRTAASEG